MSSSSSADSTPFISKIFLTWTFLSVEADRASLSRDIVPEALQALVATEQSGEDCRVCQQYVTDALTIRRHPEEHIEFSVSRLDERMRLGHVYWLPRQHMDGPRVV